MPAVAAACLGSCVPCDLERQLGGLMLGPTTEAAGQAAPGAVQPYRKTLFLLPQGAHCASATPLLYS